MSHAEALRQQPESRSVTADLDFIVRMTEKPRTFTFDPPDGLPRSNMIYEPHAVEIANARAYADHFSLDREGFAFLTHRSAVHDFDDEELIRRNYYPESERLIQTISGADRVFIFDHTRRRRITGAIDRSPNTPRQPATRVHVDQTIASGPRRVRDLLPQEAESLLRGRVQIINLWRPVVGPLWDHPLALCDARTVDPADLIASDLVYPDRAGETYAVAFNPRQSWHYVPGMVPAEALLIKCYDSQDDGRARFAPHTAFIDPDTPFNAPPRDSIEVRALVFHAA